MDCIKWVSLYNYPLYFKGVMMLIKSSLWFSYAHQNSNDFGIVNINSSDSLFEEYFVSPRELYQTKVRGRDKPYFQGSSRDNLIIPVSFAFKNTWDENKIREIKRWLCTPEFYQPLYFSHDINRIYYALLADDSSLIHNGLSQGYVEMYFHTNSPFAYSPVYISETFNSNGNLTFQMVNDGDLIIYPEIFISKPIASSKQDITIHNQTNNKSITFWDVLAGENIYLNMENKYIETNISETKRYDNYDGFFWGLEYGINNIHINGNVDIYFKYQCKFL